MDDELSIDTTDSVLVIRLSGEIEFSATERIRQAAREAVRGRAGRTVVVDLSNVTFMDSSGFGLLVALHHEASGELSLRNAAERITKRLAVTGMDGYFDEPHTLDSD